MFVTRQLLPFMAPSISHMAFGTLALALLLKLGQIIYRAFLSPLAKVPGPFWCSVTSLVDKYQATVGGRRAEWIHSLHARYGELPTL
jgi:hypothetical protein